MERNRRPAGIIAVLLLTVAVIMGPGCGGDGAIETSATDRAAPSVTSLDVTNGPRSGYQNVTISGTGFVGVRGVTFGSREASGFSVADPSRIVAVTPAGELGQVVDVTVRTDAGTAALAAAYTYWDYDLKLIKGAGSVTYTLDEIKAMPSVTGYWGAHKDPVPYNTDQYRGVLLLDLLEAVGGRAPGEEITITSADGFATTYIPELLEQMVDGTYPMWNANGTEIITDDRFAQLIVAYEIEIDTEGDGGSWAPLDAGTGPLRIALITPESDRVNQGKYNPFLVTSVEIRVTSSQAAGPGATAATAPVGQVTGHAAGTGSLTVTSLDPAGGPRSGYQNVIISGAGFTGVTGVRFGTTEAVGFSVADSTRITAITPTGGLGPLVDVTVITTSGSVTLPAAYTYWDYDLKLIKGANSVTYTVDEIKAMPSVTGHWGAINDKPYGTNEYKGVPLLALLNDVGGWAPGEGIAVTSADGFTTTYTADQLRAMVDGTYPMWNVNGASVISDDRFAQLVLAYEVDTSGRGDNWEPLRVGKGPFRLVVMTAEDDRLSQGPWNPALVVSVQVVGP